MSGRTVLHDLYKAPFLMEDPGDTGTIRPNKDLGVVPLVTAAAETRTVAVPAKAGLIMTLYMHTDGGDCVATFTSGYDQFGSTTCTFNDAGDFITVISVATATDTFRWRVLAYDGVSGPAVNMSSINMAGTTGNQEIRLTTNLADALSIEDTVGDMVVFTTTTDAKAIAIAYTTSLAIGSQANVKNSGFTVSASRTGALRVFCDDNGASIASSVRGVQSRFLLTYDQAGGTIRALQGQLKLNDGIDVTTGVYTAVQGYVELAATHICKTGAVFSCVDASAEIGTALTVDSGGRFAGIHVETTGAGTITNNGTCAGILIDKASGAASWPVGIDITASTTTTGISVGTCTTGISLPGTYTTAISASGVISATVTGASATPGTVRTIVGEITTYTTMTSGNLVGVRGSITMGGACSSTAYLYGTQGKAITGANTFSGTSLAGVYAQIDVSGGTISSGHVAALQANVYGANGGTIPMEGLYIEHAGGGVINSLIQLYGKSTYVFDISSNTHNNVSTTGTPGAVTGGTGWIKVLVDGEVRYIPLASSVS